MKKSRLFAVISLVSLHFLQASVKLPFTIDHRPYQNQAIRWVKTHVVDSDNNLLIYPKELQILANLIYFSFKRSHITLEAQEEALKTIEATWKGWQNIAQTRLDPSKDLPYGITPYEKKQLIDSFWQLQQEHEIIGQTYARTTDDVVRGSILITKCSADAVTAMRTQARAVVANAIVDVRNYVGNLFYQEKKKTLKGKWQKFVDFLYSYIPKLAVTSFVDANNANDVVSEETWTILMKIQQVSKKTWQMIEQERASFYLAFYKAIWHVLYTRGLAKEYAKIMFNQYGQLPLDYQTTYLPTPQNMIAENLDNFGFY